MKLQIATTLFLVTSLANAQALRENTSGASAADAKPQVSVEVVSAQPLGDVLQGMEQQAEIMEFQAIVQISVPIIEKMGVNQQLGTLTVDAYKAAVLRGSINLASTSAEPSVDKNTGIISPGDWLHLTPDVQIEIAVGQLARLAGASDRDADQIASTISKEVAPELTAKH